MSDAKESSKNGIGFGGALTLLFIYLKLTGHVTWSWFWVVSPIWISFSLLFVLLAAWLLITWWASR